MGEDQVEAVVKAAMQLELEEGELDEFYGDAEHPELTKVRTFAEAGVLSSNRGVVLSFDDGSEFQLQLVRSK